MPRKSSKDKFRNLPASEREIAQRIATTRKHAGLIQEVLAELIGISRHQLASIETGRVTLLMDTALKISSLLKLNLKWLADGAGDRFRYLEIPEELKRDACKYADFYAGYNGVLKDFFDDDFESRLLSIIPSDLPSTPEAISKFLSNPANVEEGKERLISNLKQIFQDSFQTMPKDLQADFAIEIGRFIHKFKADHRSEIKTYLAELKLEETKRIHLLSYSENRNSLSVKTEMEKLLSRVRRLVSGKGMKAKLAAEIDVLPPRLSEWLAGKYQPSGEVTLRLLHWVEQQERQK